jgi:biopolymer transport protein ExbD/biopolymer transport protein TolR
MRLQRKTRPADVQPDMNVTPLVDVVLVLLIIFMFVTPLMERDIDVRVPQSELVEDLNQVPPDQLVVALDAQGKLSLNQEVIAEAEYVPRLKRVLAARPPGDRLVFFTADDEASYALLVAALDGARIAGADTLGMMTDPLPGTILAPAPVPGSPTPGAPAPGQPEGPPPTAPAPTP